jgi:hypothetical protein
MELLSCWHELGRHSNGQESVHGSIDDVGGQFGNCWFKAFHVVVQDLEVDCLKDVSLGSEARDHSGVSGQSHVDDEGSGLGVHATCEHNIN